MMISIYWQFVQLYMAIFGITVKSNNKVIWKHNYLNLTMFRAMQQIDPLPMKSNANRKASVFMQKPNLIKNSTDQPHNPEKPESGQSHGFYVQSRFKDKPQWHNVQPASIAHNPVNNVHLRLTQNIGLSTVNPMQHQQFNSKVSHSSQQGNYEGGQNIRNQQQVNYNGSLSSRVNNNIGYNENPFQNIAPTWTTNNSNREPVSQTSSFQPSQQTTDFLNNNIASRRAKQSNIGVLSNKQDLTHQAQQVQAVYAVHPQQQQLPQQHQFQPQSHQQWGHQSVQQQPQQLQQLCIQAPTTQLQQCNNDQNNALTQNIDYFQLQSANQLESYVKTAIDELFVPYAQLLAHKKVEQEIKSKAFKDEKQYTSTQDYFWNKWDDYDSTRMRNPRQLDKMNKRKNNIVVKVVTKPKDVKIKMLKEEQQYVKKWREEYLKEKYGISHFQANYQQNKSIVLKYKDFLNKEKGDQSSQTDSIDNVEVSEFGATKDLQYQIDLRWLEEPQKIRRVLKTSNVKVIDNPTDKQTQEAILLDLNMKGVQFQKNAVFKLKSVQLKKYRPNFLMKIIFGYQEKQLEDFVAMGTIFERKINLPEGYDYEPTKFQGFIVKNLKIKNIFGTITWFGDTNIENVKFYTGIKIGNNQVECDIPALQKQAVVEFFGFPFNVENKSRTVILESLRKRAQGATVLSIDLERNSWQVHLDFSKQQTEAEKQRQAQAKIT